MTRIYRREVILAMLLAGLSSSATANAITPVSSSVVLEHTSSNTATSEVDPAFEILSQGPTTAPLSVTATSAVTASTLTTTLEATWSGVDSGHVSCLQDYDGGSYTQPAQTEFERQEFELVFHSTDAGTLLLSYSGSEEFTVNEVALYDRASHFFLHHLGVRHQVNVETASFQLPFSAGTSHFVFDCETWGSARGTTGNSSTYDKDVEIDWMIELDRPVPMLFGVSGSNPSELIEIDPTTGAGSTVGQLGIEFGGDTDAGMTYDPIWNQFFVVQGNSGGVPDLFSVDPISGAASSLGSTEQTISDPGMAADPIAKRFYLADESSDNLYTVDRWNGAATLIGPLGVDLNNIGLAFDPVDRVLYAVSDRNLYTINVANGTATLLEQDLVAAGGRLTGLAYDELNGVLYASEVALVPGDTILYEIDPGPPVQALHIGPIGHENVQGLAVIGPRPAPSFAPAFLGGLAFVLALSGIKNLGSMTRRNPKLHLRSLGR